jgi:UDPglucose--hexose-1-phosphate uridylyltransferase
VPAYDPDCPFCPGNEALLAAILEEQPAAAPPGWRTRVVPNKYPAVSCDETPALRPHGPYTIATGRGCHEVVIETPRHDADLTALSVEEVAAVLTAYRARYRLHVGHPDIRYVTVFRNRGAEAGASLRHPHAQLIATSLVPPGVEARVDWGRRQHEARGRCVVCEALAFEARRGERLVLEGEHILAFVPFAARAPAELWLVPKRHRASFGGIGEAELAELARLLRRGLRRLERALGAPPYNYVIESAPKGEEEAPYLHWYLRIVPSMGRTGGFELASDLSINPSIPERDAAVLRGVDEPPRDVAPGP